MNQNNPWLKSSRITEQELQMLGIPKELYSSDPRPQMQYPADDISDEIDLGAKLPQGLYGVDPRSSRGTLQSFRPGIWQQVNNQYRKRQQDFL